MKWFAIFKTGKHTDSSGNEREWTEADLDKIVESYDPTKHEAPIVIGHPKTNAPAFGWIEKLKRVGDTLYAFPKQLAKEFIEMVNKGLFKKRSISLYPDGTLRHVGFLGAQPPAVKGLPDVEFKDGEDVIEYETETGNDVIEIERDNVIEELQSKISQLQDELYKYQEIDQKIKNYEEVSQQLEEIKKEKDELKRKLEELNRTIKLREFEEYLDRKIEEGKILPKQKELIMSITITTQDYGEDDRLEKIREFIDANPKLIDVESNAKVKATNTSESVNLTRIVAEEIRKSMNNSC